MQVSEEVVKKNSEFQLIFFYTALPDLDFFFLQCILRQFKYVELVECLNKPVTSKLDAQKVFSGTNFLKRYRGKKDCI